MKKQTTLNVTSNLEREIVKQLHPKVHGDVGFQVVSEPLQIRSAVDVQIRNEVRKELCKE